MYRIIKDEPDQVADVLDELSAGVAQLLFFNGGTGISKRDTTYDVLAKRLEKTLPGFGEIFRMLSYEQIGSAAMFSRATAGVYQRQGSCFYAWFSCSGETGLGEADRARDETSGVGGWTVECSCDVVVGQPPPNLPQFAILLQIMERHLLSLFDVKRI